MCTIEPPPAASRCGSDELAHQERAAQVGVDDAVELLDRPLVQVVPLAGVDAGVVDEHVDAAELLRRAVGHRLRALDRRDVAKQPDGGPARTADLLDRALHALGIAAAGGDGRPFGGEAVCDRAADAARGAGHDGALACKASHGALLRCACDGRAPLRAGPGQIGVRTDRSTSLGRDLGERAVDVHALARAHGAGHEVEDRRPRGSSRPPTRRTRRAWRCRAPARAGTRCRGTRPSRCSRGRRSAPAGCRRRSSARPRRGRAPAESSAPGCPTSPTSAIAISWIRVAKASTLNSVAVLEVAHSSTRIEAAARERDADPRRAAARRLREELGQHAVERVCEQHARRLQQAEPADQRPEHARS